ncbi:MAG: aminoacyl-tRNA hydrolase [Gemmatimonadota bacterium]
MKLLLGLGNPGRSYESTRHNVGWMVLDHLADVWRLGGWRRDGDSRATDAVVASTRVRLIKPQTYMNLSGAVLRPWVRRETWHAGSDLLVIVDEVALPLGGFRLRASGSSGGHNGLKSVEGALESREYARLRVGIGPPDEERERYGDLADFVLDPFTKSERAVVNELLPLLQQVVESWIRDGVLAAMNAYNRRRST